MPLSLSEMGAHALLGKLILCWMSSRRGLATLAHHPNRAIYTCFLAGKSPCFGVTNSEQDEKGGQQPSLTANKLHPLLLPLFPFSCLSFIEADCFTGIQPQVEN